jgi:hypothetical protein
MSVTRIRQLNWQNQMSKYLFVDLLPLCFLFTLASCFDGKKTAGRVSAVSSLSTSFTCSLAYVIDGTKIPPIFLLFDTLKETNASSCKFKSIELKLNEIRDWNSTYDVAGSNQINKQGNKETKACRLGMKGGSYRSPGLKPRPVRSESDEASAALGSGSSSYINASQLWTGETTAGC